MPCFAAGKQDIEDVDVILIGGGCMSTTMGVILQELEPAWKIKMFERLGSVGEESSNGWNNAGTGHAALCEPNYTPAGPDGTVCPKKAIGINEQFQQTLQFYQSLIQRNDLENNFLSTTPHVTFVRGEKDIAWLKQRYSALKDQPLFAGMEFSEDPEKIAEWAPLLAKGRSEDDKIACSYVEKGTDIDYGALTKGLAHTFTKNGGECLLYHTVTGLKKEADGRWRVTVSKRDIGAGSTTYRAKFVFCGAGGWALPVLQKSGIREIRGYAGFPISGEFLVCQNLEVVKQHKVKAYGKAAVGAPPMSVPHLDARVIDGNPMLLFGPCAGFSPRFLKTGGLMDLVKSIKFHNIIPMSAAGLQNLDLCVYLAKELVASKAKRLKSLREFCPEANGEDWTLITAGQRVQCMKKDKKKIGILQFGTEVITSTDKEGAIAGLLGASPGASIAVSVMIDALQRCYPTNFKEGGEWAEKIKGLVPTYGIELNKHPELAAEWMQRTCDSLNIGLDR